MKKLIIAIIFIMTINFIWPINATYIDRYGNFKQADFKIIETYGNKGIRINNINFMTDSKTYRNTFANTGKLYTWHMVIDNGDGYVKIIQQIWVIKIAEDNQIKIVFYENLSGFPNLLFYLILDGK